MFSSKIELMLRIISLPLTAYSLCSEDYIKKLYEAENIKDYKKIYIENVIQNIYRELHKYNLISNLDEVNLLFEKFYSYYNMKEHSSLNNYYLEIISKLAKCFICHRNGKLAFKYWESENEESFIGPYGGINKAVMWNLLNRILNTDVIVIKYLQDNEMDDEKYLEGYYNSIALEDIVLEKILQKGIAETHIHKGAGINFYISWSQLMSNVSNENAKSIYRDELYNDDILNLNYNLADKVKKIAISRVLMASFLDEKSQLESNASFIKYVNSKFENNINIKKILSMIFNLKDNSIEYDINRCWEYILEELNISLYLDNDIKSNLIDEDIINKIFNSDVNTNIENIFLMRSLNYIKSHNDKDFNTLFWQYIRVKNQVLELKVQGSSIKGLENFVKYYSRSTDIATYDQKEYWKMLMNIQLQSNHIKKLEFRTGFGKGKSKGEIEKSIKKIVKSFFEAYLDILENPRYSDFDYPNIGLVFHMIKTLDKSNPEKCWKNYKNQQHHYKNEISYKDIQEKYLRQVTILNEIREEIPNISDFIIGIDAASIESNTEPWVFAPVYRKARDSKSNKLFVCSNRLKNLGFTYHVGEDFRHLVTGLRRIDEVLEHFSFHSGDRIGHGIALGVNIETWAKNNHVVTMHRIEYMENLLWIWGLYKDGLYSNEFDLGYLELEIMKQAEEIYSKTDGITVYNLWKAYQSRFKEFEISDKFSFTKARKNNSIFCKHVDNIHAISWNEDKLRKTYHCKCYLAKMMEPIQIKVMNEDIDRFKKIQDIIIKKVNDKGIIVETNPTSNSVIGSVEDIFNHYIHNLNRIDKFKFTNHNVMVSINSDDPSVFNTNVSNEFAYIYYSLQDKGYGREDIISWIDNIRKMGMDSSFIDDNNIPLNVFKDNIKKILEKLNIIKEEN